MLLSRFFSFGTVHEQFGITLSSSCLSVSRFPIIPHIVLHHLSKHTTNWRWQTSTTSMPINHLPSLTLSFLSFWVVSCFKFFFVILLWFPLLSSPPIINGNIKSNQFFKCIQWILVAEAYWKLLLYLHLSNSTYCVNHEMIYSIYLYIVTMKGDLVLLFKS